MKTLIIIDVQNDYFPGGLCPLHQPEKALANIQRVLGLFRQAGLPVVHIQHINTRPGALFFLPHTEGVKIHPGLTPIDGEALMVKHAPNSFFETGLADFLQRQGASELVICGMMTHMCIDTTVRAAKDYGFAVTLLYDGCAAKDISLMGQSTGAETVHNTFMASLDGMFAKVVPTEDFRL